MGSVAIFCAYTENTLWAESPDYIADRYFEEQEILNSQQHP